MIRQLLTLILAFAGGFLAVGSWIWAPQISRLMPSFSSGTSSVGLSVSLFADANRLGRPETAPVVRSCIFRVLDLGREARKLEPSAAYFILKAGSMQASVSTLVGKSDKWFDNHTTFLASKWGELANCIYAQDDRELCDPDNRAAMVEPPRNSLLSRSRRKRTSRRSQPATHASSKISAIDW